MHGRPPPAVHAPTSQRARSWAPDARTRLCGQDCVGLENWAHNTNFVATAHGEVRGALLAPKLKISKKLLLQL